MSDPVNFVVDVKEEPGSNSIDENGLSGFLDVELREGTRPENNGVQNEGNSQPAIVMDFWKTEDIEIPFDEIPRFEANDERFCHLSEDGVVITFTCGVCKFEASKESSLMKHMRSHNVRRVCPICGLVACSKTELERHLAVHAKEVPYVCEHCLHGFFRETSLRSHDCRKRPKFCQHCGAVFKSKTKLIRHIRDTHRNRPVPKKRYCHLCEFSCWSGDSLNAHLRTHAGNKTLHCPHCIFEFNKLEALQRHMRIHKNEPSFTCPYCGVVFAKYGEVKIHMELHKDAHLLHCDSCNYTTPSRINLKAHRSRVHNPNKHKCPHCDYKTAAIYRYNIHLLSHKEATHSCQQCDYKTKYKWDLKRHNQTHEKNPNYRCPHCEYTCTRLDNLKLHAARHNAKLPLPDFIGSL